jgi:hypothetical protein
MIYQLNYGIEYLGLGHVVYQQKVSTQIARVPYTYTWYLTENKEVPDRNIGVPPVHKYAIYRTLKFRPNSPGAAAEDRLHSAQQSNCC